MKSQPTMWCLYDVLNEESIGIWSDISAAEEFMLDNETSEDVWTLMPAMDTFELIKSY